MNLGIIKIFVFIILIVFVDEIFLSKMKILWQMFWHGERSCMSDGADKIMESI
jgi:hypothetical protein